MEDGERQRKRDAVYTEGGVAQSEEFPSRWTAGRVQKWLYGYDAYEEVERAYEKETF